jgi:hypothetical protein
VKKGEEIRERRKKKEEKINEKKSQRGVGK